MPLSKDCRNVRFREPQPFGAWEFTPQGAFFRFQPQVQMPEWLSFECLSPLTLILGTRTMINIVENLPNVSYRLLPGAVLTHRDGGETRSLHFDLQENAQLVHTTTDHVHQEVERSVDVFLKAPEASVQWAEAVWLEQQACYRCQLKITHQAERTHSNCLLKSVVAEAAQLHLRYDATVQANAFDASAHQKNLNYVLGNGRVVAQPHLTILNRKIKASHGTATQPIPPEALFYLRSRGLSALEAQRLFLQGFMGELDDID